MTSIVILTHNQLYFTRRCVESILCWTDEPYELIFVDNGSTDGTLEYLERLRRAGGVRILANRSNRGFPCAANQGIRAAKGDHVLLLNNDTVLTPGWLRRLLDAMRSHPSVGLVGPVSNKVSGVQQIQVDYGDLSEVDSFAQRWAASQEAAIADTNRLVGFCLLIKREVIDKIGFLDEQFGIGCYEDDDYCRRAIEAGYRAVVARRSFVHHFGGMTFRNSGIDFAGLMCRNLALFNEKWTGNRSQEAGDRKQGAGVRDQEAGAEEVLSDACHVVPALAPLTPDSCPLIPGLRRSEDGTMLISCCMIVRNNKKYIHECILSLLAYVDQLIVVDTGSDDGTDEICRQLGAEVYYFPWCDDFSAARNESLKYAKGKWVFWIDSDDVLPPESGVAMRELLTKPIAANVYGFTMKIHWPTPGDDGRATEVDHVKLFLNHPAHRFEHRIHEQILGPIHRNGGDIVMTDIRIIHKNHDHSFEGQKRKLERDLRILHQEEKELPMHPFTMFNLGMTYANKADRPGLGDNDDLEKAKHYLHRAINCAGPHDSTTPACYALLVSCHRRLGEEEQARYMCNKGLAKFPLDNELRHRKAMILRDQGGPSLEEAVKLLQDILDRPEPRHLTSGEFGMSTFLTRHSLAQIHAQLGQWDKAEEQWRLAVKECADFQAGWYGVAEALARQQKWEDAERFGSELVAARRLPDLGMLVMGDSLHARGRHDAARHAWQMVLQLKPGHPPAMQRLGLLDRQPPGPSC